MSKSEMDAVIEEVRKAFKKNIDCNQRELTRSLKKKFGQGLSFKNLKALRDGFEAGRYDAVAKRELTPIFKKRQEKADARIRSGGKPGRPPLSKNKKKTKKKRASKKTRARSTLTSAKPRGDRRRTPIARGRRKSDKALVAFDKAPNHLVVVFEQGGVVDYRYKSRTDAEAQIKTLLKDGIEPHRIAYYKKQDVTVTVSI